MSKGNYCRVVSDLVFEQKLPRVSIVMPIHNQGPSIKANLQAIQNTMSTNFEMILINDASTDNTDSELKVFLGTNPSPSMFLTRIRVVKSSRPLYETRSDVIGFCLAESRFALEIQADMSIYEFGFDHKLLSALIFYPDILMVSGRGTHNLAPIAVEYMNSPSGANSLVPLAKRAVLVPKRCGSQFFFHKDRPKMLKSEQPQYTLDSDTVPNWETFRTTGRAGRLGSLIDSRNSEFALATRNLWLGQSVMRGPLMLDLNRYFEVGGLNDKAHFLGLDDHDLALRGYEQRGYRVGYTPIGFDSPLELGSTRARQSFKSELTRLDREIRARKHRKGSSLTRLINGSPIQLPNPEIRKLPPIDGDGVVTSG